MVDLLLCFNKAFYQGLAGRGQEEYLFSSPLLFFSFGYFYHIQPTTLTLDLQNAHPFLDYQP